MAVLGDGALATFYAMKSTCRNVASGGCPYGGDDRKRTAHPSEGLGIKSGCPTKTPHSLTMAGRLDSLGRNEN